MKPKQIGSHRERRAKVEFRKLARKIPDNVSLTNILLQFEVPFRNDFYRRVRPYLRFSPAPLEVINGNS